MSSISAGTTTTTGYVVTSDTTGALVLKTGASDTTAVTISTSQNVGIGTSSPSQKLHVVGNIRTANCLIEDTSTNVNFGTITAGYLAFLSNGGAEGMRLTSTGLGIGTSSPAYKLHVSGAGYIFGLNGGGTSRVAQTFGNTGGNLDLGIEGSAGGTLFTGGSAYASCIGSSNATPLQLATNGTVRATFDTSGNLGLGVTPSAWYVADSTKVIQVGTLAIQNQSSGGTIYSFLGSNYYQGSDTNFKYVTTNTATQYRQYGGIHAWFNAASGSANANITFTQAMTLDASSNLFVGWTPTGSGEAKFAIRPSSTYGMWVSNGFSNSTPYGLEFGLQPGHGSYRSAIRGAPSNFGGDDNGMLLFYTSNSYNTGSLPERARITAAGDLLLGQTGFASGAGISLRGDSSSAYKGSIWSGVAQSTNSYTSYELYSTNASAYRFYVGLGGTIYATNTTISAISDIRFKENVRDLNVGLAEVMALKPRLYDWKEGKGANIKNARGFIAQEFEEVFPDLIDTWKDPAPEGEDPYKSVRQDLVPVLVKAIQEQQAIITTLTERITALEAK